MRRALVLLTLLAACGVTDPETFTIRVQGTVRSAEDESVLVGATVRAGSEGWSDNTYYAQVRTDNQGRYSLSFDYTFRGGCNEREEGEFVINVSKTGFRTMNISPGGFMFDNEPDWATPIRCTDEIQTVNVWMDPEP